VLALAFMALARVEDGMEREGAVLFRLLPEA
jgi:hypothetical protein